MLYTNLATLQMSGSWHDRGLFMGLHWVWWLFWVLTLFVVIWALWRAFADRRVGHLQAEKFEAAEAALHARFDRGEIGEEEFVRLMKVLRQTKTGP